MVCIFMTFIIRQFSFGYSIKYIQHMSCDMRIPTMLYVRPAKPQISLAHMQSLTRTFSKSLDYSMSVKLLTEF